MAGEHLPISNYDDLNATETVSKLKILAGRDDGVTVDWQEVLNHEQNRPDGPRDSVVNYLNNQLGIGTEGTETPPTVEEQQTKSEQASPVQPGAGTGAAGVAGGAGTAGQGGATTEGTGGETTSGTGSSAAASKGSSRGGAAS